ncbi:SNF2 family N-terminal domain-containing protein [Aspergillus pseudodeflectus]|uniref:SNF2 family N-terminal domain-containing protein n=1 Tax=Aspergillus pseudodeflectus TaxID=176178 RepID=A0ABR4KCK8_9EURO
MSAHDAITGYMAGNNSENFHVSPETIMNNATVDPSVEADNGSLTPCLPGPDQTPPTSAPSVCPEEMEGLSLQLNADPCHRTGGELQVPLLTHQKQGLAWMMEMENSDHKGGILADDMGLGKTVQALALIESHPSPSPARRATLVVVPATLIQQWEHEIERLLRSCPGRGRVYTLYGNKRRVGFSELSQYDIVLTSYGVMATELGRKQRGRRWVTSASNPSGGQTLSILGPTSHWHRVILDEAQSIQNDQSKTAIACRDIDATYRWCLTGTPLTNHLRVLYSLLKFLRVQPCPDFDVFDMVFRRTSDGRECDRDARIALRQSLEAFILRRTWLTLGDGPPLLRLPPCMTNDVYVRLSDMEQVLYIAVERSFQAQFNELQAANLLNRCTSHVHSLLRRLQQACCHPFLVPELPQIINDHCRAKAWLETNASRFSPGVIHRLRNNTSLRDCPVCFDPVENPMIFFPCGHSACYPCFTAMFPATSSPQDSWNARAAMRCPLCRVTVDPALATDYVAFARRHYAPDQGLTEAAGWYRLLGKFLLWVAGPANGRIHPTPTAFGTDSDLSTWLSSAKIDKALEIVQNVRDQGHGEKILIFSQFTALLDLIEIPLLQRGWIFRRYHRNMTPADRHDAVEAFTNEPDCSLMLVSFGAGYSGLNLTMASQVVIMDPSSDPRVEELAVSRARRVGQQRPVYIHRILASSTVDDRLIRFPADSHVESNTLDGAPGRVLPAPGGSDLAYLFQGNQ